MSCIFCSREAIAQVVADCSAAGAPPSSTAFLLLCPTHYLRGTGHKWLKEYGDFGFAENVTPTRPDDEVYHDGNGYLTRLTYTWAVE